MSSREVSPAYFDFLTAVCQSHGFAPRVLHEVRSVMSQIAFVGCGQGIALVPASMHKLASENVVVRPLKERVMVVTAALAWDPARHNPMVDAMVSRRSLAVGQGRRLVETIPRRSINSAGGAVRKLRDSPLRALREWLRRASDSRHPPPSATLRECF
ncbi:hypothetical protein G3O01_08455 [Burkholderia sp. Ac-20365]|nr:hypothetical protein [Burkholderia sp. Ac-20365]